MMKNEDKKVSMGFLLPLLFFEVLIPLTQKLPCDQNLSEDMSRSRRAAQPQREEIGTSRTSGGGDLMI